MPTVDADCCVGTVETDVESLGQKARYGCLASPAAAAQPPHMLEVWHLTILYRRVFARQRRRIRLDDWITPSSQAVCRCS